MYKAMSRMQGTDTVLQKKSGHKECALKTETVHWTL